MSEQSPAASEGWILAAPAAEALRIWGIPPAERLRRGFAASGIERVLELAPDDAPPPVPAAGVVVVRADWVLDERIL
ncbi:MAG: hypothetical protein ACR2P8_10940, partial [Myxococcota bacterium]